MRFRFDAIKGSRCPAGNPYRHPAGSGSSDPRVRGPELRRGAETIMAGLLIKELRIRGELERCLIVAPLLQRRCT